MDITSLALAKSYTDKRVAEMQPSDVDLSNYLSKKELESFVQKYGFDTYKVFNVVATSREVAYQQLQQLKVELDTGLNIGFPLVFFHHPTGSGWGPSGIFCVSSYNGTTLSLQALHQAEDSSVSYTKGYSNLTTKTITLKVVFKADGTVNTTETGANQGATKTFINPDYDYTTPYIPKYAGSPATKKYVDDAIAAAITSALEGEY